MKFLTRLLATLGAILVLLLIWGAAIEPRLIDVEEEAAEIPGLPAAWAGRRVGVIADLQVGMWLDNTGTIRRIVERLVEQQPAVVLILGDFIYHPLGEETMPETREELDEENLVQARNKIAEAVDLVRQLPAAGIPTYAVLGNHDYGMERQDAAKVAWLARDLREALVAAGIPVLQNQAVPLRSEEEEPFYLVGLGSHWADNDKPAIALDAVPDEAPRMVMMHNPDSFDAVPARAAPLAVAGHTHGGQVSVPFAPEWSWMVLIQNDEVHADGWITGYGARGNRLYVNRGIGFSMIPVRIAAIPEITLFTLQPAG